MRISDWSSDVCSSDLLELELRDAAARQGITADIHRGSLPDAFEALYGRGDRDLHDRLVAGAVNKLETYDAVLLAQFSMASVRPLLHLATPVLDPISDAVQRMRMLAGDRSAGPRLGKEVISTVKTRWTP